MTSSHKIVFIGMDNAGKTSIINILSQNFADMQVITPTQRVERSQFNILGKELLIWDFGGQEKYREQYLMAPEKYFDEISFLYFVVDIQDPEKLFLSIEYFERVLEGLTVFSPNAQVIILYHKNDPDAKEKIERLNLRNEFNKAIMPYLDAKIADSMEDVEDPPIRSYFTSIQAPMSIVKAVSEPLLGATVLHETIADMLKNVVISNQIYHAALFTKNHIQIGEYSDPLFNEEDRDAVMRYYLRNIVPNLDMTIEMAFKYGITLRLYAEGFEIVHGSSKLPFYLVFIYENGANFTEKAAAIQGFQSNLNTMVSSMNIIDFYSKILNSA